MSRRWIAIAVSMIIIFMQGSVDGATLHVVLVGDINAEEHVLESATKKDLEAMHAEMLKVARNIGYESSEQIHLGYSLSSKKILSHCKKMNVERDDIVFFYFSGHGYTTPKQWEDPWPNIALSGDQRGIPVSRVANVVRNLKPRLGIIFADCCNSLFSDEYAPLVLKQVVHTHMGRVEANYRKMFLDQQGLIIIAGSKKAQPSLATYAGSFCTLAFLQSFREKMSQSSAQVNWESLLSLADNNLQRKASEYDRRQDMIWAIER